MKKILLFVLTVALSKSLHCQESYTSYLTGSPIDLDVQPNFGLCLMGGATENDGAMTWLLEKSNGGDVLVLRTSGEDGYNDYMYSDLNVELNSVETIVFHNATASQDAYVLERLSGAEVIWFAGGDQSDYVEYWKETAVEDAINNLINVRGGAIGGTSAGMAILGDAYFSALEGSVTSEEMLADPLRDDATIGYNDFIDAVPLTGVITETHFNDPDRIRYGRIMGFMARIKHDHGLSPKAIAANEYCAVTIDADGGARAWGDYIAGSDTFGDDYIYFLQENPTENAGPEIILQNSALTWDRAQQAVKVYKLPAKNLGENTFDVNNWSLGFGGSWQNWWVSAGELFMADAEPLSTSSLKTSRVRVFPNPARDVLNIDLPNPQSWSYSLIDVSGARVAGGVSSGANIDVMRLQDGIYTLILHSEREVYHAAFVKID